MHPVGRLCWPSTLGGFHATGRAHDLRLAADVASRLVVIGGGYEARTALSIEDPLIKQTDWGLVPGCGPKEKPRHTEIGGLIAHIVRFGICGLNWIM